MERRKKKPRPIGFAPRVQAGFFRPAIRLPSRTRDDDLDPSPQLPELVLSEPGPSERYACMSAGRLSLLCRSETLVIGSLLSAGKLQL